MVRIAVDILDRINSMLQVHPVVLFMKGTPEFPMCRFSMRAAQLLRASGGEFHCINVLDDPETRASLPRYSNWPTFPQLFIQGELIGGCDITEELAMAGQLHAMVCDARVLVD